MIGRSSLMSSLKAAILVSRMAAQIYVNNDRLWPEMLRALIVHSAEWTQAMQDHLPPDPKKQDVWRLLRRYGHGVPSPERTLRSKKRDVTLVVEGKKRHSYASHGLRFTVKRPEESLENFIQESKRISQLKRKLKADWYSWQTQPLAAELIITN